MRYDLDVPDGPTPRDTVERFTLIPGEDAHVALEWFTSRGYDACIASLPGTPPGIMFCLRNDFVQLAPAGSTVERNPSSGKIDVLPPPAP